MVSSENTYAYLVRRLHEKSTWLMLPVMLSLYGVQLDAPTYQTISTIGLSVSGLLLVLLPEKNTQRALSTLDYLTARCKEPTTYTAIPILLGTIGVHLNDVTLHNIGSVLIGVGGMLSGLLAEQGVNVPISEPVAFQSTANPPVEPPTT